MVEIADERAPVPFIRSALAVAVLAFLAGQSVCAAVAGPPKGQKHFSVTYQIDPAHDGAINPERLRHAAQPALERDALGISVRQDADRRGQGFRHIRGRWRQPDPIDLANGQIRWQQLFGSQIQAAYDGGVLFVMGATGQLQAFNAGTGEPIWSQQLPTAGSAPPMAVDGRLYLDLPGALYAFDGATGGPL